jgi:hypothetical protein
MFNKKFEDRLSDWVEFRNTLETDSDPIKKVIEFFNKAPLGGLAADPYDRKTWPNPWQLIQENIYCDFVKLLAICYTLQLCDRFSGYKYRLYIAQDVKQTYYLLEFNNQIIGYDIDNIVGVDVLETLNIETKYDMPVIN